MIRFYIIAGVLAVIGLVVWRIDYLTTKVEKLEVKLSDKKAEVFVALSANKVNLLTVGELEEKIKACTSGKEANAQQAIQEEFQHNNRIITLQAKYDAIKNTKIVSSCANMLIDDSVIRLLTKTSSRQD